MMYHKNIILVFLAMWLSMVIDNYVFAAGTYNYIDIVDNHPYYGIRATNEFVSVTRGTIQNIKNNDDPATYVLDNRIWYEVEDDMRDLRSFENNLDSYINEIVNQTGLNENRRETLKAFLHKRLSHRLQEREHALNSLKKELPSVKRKEESEEFPWQTFLSILCWPAGLVALGLLFHYMRRSISKLV